jgi:predicted permease
MELWSELFSDSVGIMSALVIGFIILMAIWFAWYFIVHMMRDSAKQDKSKSA